METPFMQQTRLREEMMASRDYKNATFSMENQYLKNRKSFHIKKFLKGSVMIIPASLVIGVITGLISGSFAWFVFPWITIVAISGFLNFRKYKDVQVKYHKVEEMLESLGRKHLPIETAGKMEENRSFIESLPKYIEPDMVSLSNDEQEKFLNQRMMELEELKINDSVSEEVLKKRVKFFQFGPYVSPLFETFVKQKGISFEWVEKQYELSQSYKQSLEEVYAIYRKNSGIISSGNRGENRVEEELKMLSKYCTYLSNVRLEVEGQSVETDNIIFSPNGIFFLEVKNFSESGSYNVRITKDGQWQKVYGNGKAIPMNNVTAQHNRHLFLKDKFIRDMWEKRYGTTAPVIDYHPIIVIANDKIMIENESDMPVIRVSQIYHHMKKFQDNLPKDTLDKVKSIIETNKLPVKSYAIPYYNEGLKAYRERVLLLEENAIEIAKLMDEFYDRLWEGKYFMTHETYYYNNIIL